MTTFTDLFSGAALGSDWAAPAVAENGGTPSVGGGVASGAGSSARVVAAVDAGTITITVVIPTAPSNFSAVGLLYLDGVTQNGYTLYCRQEPGDFQIFFSRFSAGISTGLASEFVGAQSYPLTIVGTYDPATDTFGITLNGVPKTSRTDSTYTSLTRVGFLIDTDMTITSFVADPIVGGGSLENIRYDYSKHLKLALVGLS